MSGIDFIEKLINDVARHETRLWVVFFWNSLLSLVVLVLFVRTNKK